MRESSNASTVHTLFAIPYAGGNAFFYQPLKEHAHDFHLQPLELPGRGRRSAEPLYTCFDALVQDLCIQIMAEASDNPFAILGHSMGGALAYGCAQRLRDLGENQPQALFVSGCSAPVDGRMVDRCPRHLLPREDFFVMLREFGGCPEEVFQEPKLLEYFEPILRADFQAIEGWRPSLVCPLDIPVTVLGGKSDMIHDAALAGWSQATSQDCQVHMFAGGHFFIRDHWSQIAAIVRHQLCATCVLCE